MFNHLHHKIILDYIRRRSLCKYKIVDIFTALKNYYGKETH